MFGVDSRSCAPDDEHVFGVYRRRGLILRLSPEVADTLRSRTFDRGRSTLVLFHEHMHLVQDTTSLYGALSHLAHWAKLQSIANHNAGEDKIRLPIVRPEGRVGTLDAQSDTRWTTAVEGSRGTEVDVPCEITDAVPDASATSLFDDGTRRNEFPTPRVTLTVARRGRGEIEYVFGAAAVREGLAALMERALVRAEPLAAVAKPALPYDVLPLLGDHLARRHGVAPPDEFTLACLADRSLMTVAPGFFAYAYIERHVRAPARPLEDVAAEVDAEHPFPPAFTLPSTLDSLREYARNFSVSAQKARAFSWFLDNLTAGLRRREADPYFYFRPIEAADPWDAYATLLFGAPIPLVQIPGEPNLFDVDPANVGDDAGTEAAMLFALLDYVADLHVKRDQPVKCPLLAACTMTFKDRRCETSPWTRTIHEPTCVTGSAFAMLNVIGKRVRSYHKEP